MYIILKHLNHPLSETHLKKESKFISYVQQHNEKMKMAISFDRYANSAETIEIDKALLLSIKEEFQHINLKIENLIFNYSIYFEIDEKLEIDRIAYNVNLNIFSKIVNGIVKAHPFESLDWKEIKKIEEFYKEILLPNEKTLEEVYQIIKGNEK